ncbi:MAG: hypothetical protein ACOCV8_05245 [Spirochaetota bacterium]
MSGLILNLLFINSPIYAIDINTNLDKVLNTADKLELVIELKYKPKIEGIIYQKSDIKKDKAIEIKNYAIPYSSIKNNIIETKKQFDIETRKEVEYSREKQGKYIIEKIIYTFQVFEIEDLYIRPLKIIYTFGNSEREVYTPPIPILSKALKIKSDSNGQPLLKNLKGPFYEDNFTQLLIVLVITGVFLISSIIIIIFIRKRKKYADEEVKIKNPYETALDELEKLKGHIKTSDKEKIKDIYIKMSLIIRRFLSEELNLFIMENTTDKVEELLNNSVYNKDISEKIISFLKECDAVKFAKYRPDYNKLRIDFEEAFNIIYDFKSPFKEQKVTIPE